VSRDICSELAGKAIYLGIAKAYVPATDMIIFVLI